MYNQQNQQAPMYSGIPLHYFSGTPGGLTTQPSVPQQRNPDAQRARGGHNQGRQHRQGRPMESTDPHKSKQGTRSHSTDTCTHQAEASDSRETGMAVSPRSTTECCTQDEARDMDESCIVVENESHVQSVDTTPDSKRSHDQENNGVPPILQSLMPDPAEPSCARAPAKAKAYEVEKSSETPLNTPREMHTTEVGHSAEHTREPVHIDGSAPVNIEREKMKQMSLRRDEPRRRHAGREVSKARNHECKKNIETNRAYVSELLTTYDFLALQEHWLFAFQLSNFEAYFPSHFSYSIAVDADDPLSPTQKPRGYGGVATLHRKDCGFTVKKRIHGDSRIVVLEVLSNPSPCICNIYMPSRN